MSQIERIGLLAGLFLWPAVLPAQKITFESDRDRNADIFVMDADGGNPFNVTRNPSTDNNPWLSPDGTRIAFDSRRDGNDEVYVVDINGENLINLSNNPSIDHHPRWSPDGRFIAFESYRDGNAEIYLVSAAGPGNSKHGPCGPPPGTANNCGEVVNLTRNAAFDAYPRWSPDGSKIVFLSLRGGNDDVYLMDADGGHPTRLTDNPSQDFDADWLPDGSKISFRSTRDGNSEIYVMDLDGSNQTNITNSPNLELEMQWSPDASKIVMVIAGLGTSDIYLLDADGILVNLTLSPGYDFGPQWSPDGSKILFYTYRNAKPDVYVMDADGGNSTNLTNGMGRNYSPRWGPGPSAAERLIQALIEHLASLVEEGVLSYGQANGLAGPLENALSSLGRDKSPSACSQLQDFVDNVVFMTPFTIPVMISDELIADAASIRAMLHCGQ